MELFETKALVEEVDHIDNFYATHIFDDNMSKEVWFSPDGGCLDVKGTTEVAYSGTGALHITWDKGKGDCDWIGMGIGWENWSGKNFGSIYDHAALSFKVRTDGRTLKTLPIAICLEDFGDVQAWTGFSRKMLDAPEITDEWATVTIPILAFNWSQFDADISSIKQMIIQFEASGDIYIDEVRIIEHQGSMRSRIEMPLLTGKLSGDEIFNRLKGSVQAPVVIEEHSVHLAINDNTLYVLADIVDDTPLQNQNSGDKVWDGDAIEIAFSSDPGASPSRSYYLTSDKQVGIRATEKPHFWDWKSHVEIEGATSSTELTERGYRLEASIPLEALGVKAHELGQIYGIEIAIDLGDDSGRKTQLRWNAPDVGGFYENPSLWGEMKIVSTDD